MNGSMTSKPPTRRSVRPAPPADRDRAVLRWAAACATADYLALLKLPKTPRGPTDAEVRAAYRVFSRAFHPDNYRDASAEVQAAAARVFREGADAYHVLSDPILRLRYLAALATGKVRVPLEELERGARKDAGRAAAMPAASLAKTERGRTHGARADQLLTLGELAYAKAELERAVACERDNLGLAAKLAAIEARLFAPRGSR